MSVENRPCALIIGHSFVRRFRDFLNGGGRLSQNISRNLNLDDDCRVYISGIGGRKVDTLEHFDLDKLKVIRPKIVVLEIGSNDLGAPDINPENVGKQIISVVSRLKEEFGVRQVLVCKILPRRKQPHPSYNQLVSELNIWLGRALDSIPNATFWRHRGLFYNSTNVYHRDGIHLNPYGQKLLYKSYRGAIIYGLRKL